MALLPFYWLLVSFVCLGSGALLFSLFFPKKGPNGLSVPQLALLGAALVSFESVAASLLIPVNPMLVPVFGLQAAAGFWLTRDTFGWNILLRFHMRRDMLAITAVLLVAMGMKAAAPVGAFDAGLYYRQTVLWIQQYGTVPGLGNLHGRLAFNSAWHVFAALFSFDLGQNRILEDVNEWLTLVFGLEIAGCIIKTEKGPVYPILAVALAFVLPPFLAGIGADLPAILVAIWLLMTAHTVIFKNDPSKNDINETALFWMVVAGLFLVLIKLSMLAAGMLAAAACISIRSAKTKAILAGTTVLVLGCWLGRFYMQTGYLLYPVPQAAVLPINPDWQVPIGFVKNEVDDVEAFAKVPYSVYPADKMANMDRVKMPVQEWAPLWFKGLNGYNRILTIISLLSLIAVLVRLSSSKTSSSQVLKIGMAAYVVSAFLLWFWKAPDPRFAYGLLVGMPFVAGLIYFDDLKNGHRFYIGAALAIVITCLDVRSLKEHFLLPGPYPVAQLKSVSIRNGTISVPVPPEKGDWETRCWNTPLPCTYEGNPSLRDLEMRGNDLRHGFRTRR